MNAHPLQDYIDLIENSTINVIYSDFHNVPEFIQSFDPNIFDDNEMFWAEDKKAYILKSLLEGEIKSTFTYENHLQGYTSHYNKKFKEIVRLYFLNTPEKAVEYMKQLQREIGYLMKVASQKHEPVMVHLIAQLKSLDTFLSEITGGYFNKVDKKEIKKIKWLGKINTLITLFYDLSNDRNNLGKKLIEFDRVSIRNFIKNNFIDKDGVELSENTIYTVLDPEKPDKKAKESLLLREDMSDAIPKNKLPILKKHFANNKTVIDSTSINPIATHSINKKD